jgi:hypothetical protein
MSEHGFALPCFANGPRPNTWYTAICSVSGDHLGDVVGFEPFLSEDIRPVATGQVRRVKPGDRWCDVFLWNGQHYVGEPSELWATLADVRAEIGSRAPLSLLDLAAASGSAEEPALAVTAFAYLSKRFGESKAKLWRQDIFFRQLAILILNRLTRTRKLAATPDMIRSVEIKEYEEGKIVLEASEGLLRLLSAHQNQGLLEGLQAAAGPFNLSVGPIDHVGLLGPATTPLAQAPDSSPASRTQRVLIATFGKRAKEIGRLVSLPDWLPIWKNEKLPRDSYGIRRVSERAVPPTREIESVVIDILDSGAPIPAEVEGYGVIVAIVDDDIFTASGGGSPPFTRVADLFGSHKSAIRLLAPALPRDKPARMLGDELDQLTDNYSGVQAILDTSTSRSPFWSGNRRHALDRRIADVIAGAAILAGGTSPLGDFLRSFDRGSARIPILSFALGSSKQAGNRKQTDPAKLAMASEAAWSFTSSKGHEHFDTYFRLHWLDKRSGSTVRGKVELQELDANFGQFGLAAVDSIVGSEKFQPLEHQAVPGTLLRSLEFPSHACGIETHFSPRDGVLVTAETPSLEAIKAAEKENWGVVRYTDEETVREHLDYREKKRLRLLPREIRLPQVRRLEQNRHLATRGVDPRDVLRVREETLATLNLSSQLDLRHYRTSIEPENRSTSIVAFPSDQLSFADTQKFGFTGVSRNSGVSLSPMSSDREEALPENGQRSPKRPADLRIAWSSPPSRMSRFVVMDGALPIALARLEDDEVPAQKMFIVDGDAAVPSLLQSSVFEIWARATLSRSLSWMSRFSVTGTFETFPVVRPFHLKRQEAGTTLLLLRPGDEKLDNLAARWATMEIGHHSELSGNAVRNELDVAILDAYGLPSDASDIMILDRLLATNLRS